MSNPFDGLDPNNQHDVVTAAKKVGIEPDQLRQMMPSIDPYLGSDSESGMGIGDFPNLALTGAMQANKMVVDTASFLGNKIHPKASETLGLDSASQFFQRGIDAAEDLRSDRLKAEMSRPIYHEGTGDWQMPSAIQATGLVTETLPMMPMFATAGRAATGALQMTGLGAGVSTVGGYGATNAAFIGGDTYREAKDEITSDLSKKISANEFNGKSTVDDSIQRGEEIDLIAENYAQEAGNNMLLPGFVTGAVGLGIPALRTVDKPLSGVRARMGNAGLGAFTEGASEFAEEAGQGIAVNNARIDAGNTEVDLFDGVIDRGAKGLVGGAASGAAFGAMNNQAEWQRTAEPTQDDNIFVENEDDVIAPELNEAEPVAQPQAGQPQPRDFEKEFSENVSDEEMEFVFQQAEVTNPQVANDIAKDESLSDAEAFFKIKDLVKESGIPYLYDMSTDEMLEVATQLDKPLVDELAIPARNNMSDTEFRSNLANIIQQSDSYKKARNVFNQRIAQNNQTRDKSRQRINELKADSLRKRFTDTKLKGQFALARMQERSQQRQAEKQAGFDQRKTEIENRVDRPTSNFAGMAEREQAVASDSSKREWVNKAADIKSSRKRFKKKLRQQQANKRVQLEMDRFYKKMEDDKQAQDEAQNQVDWENTRLARTYRQAQEIGMDGEFNRIAKAVNQGIEQLPEAQRQKEYEVAETALTEWVDEEYAGFDGNTGLEGNAGDSGAVADTNEEGSVGIATMDQQSGPINGEPSSDSATESTSDIRQTGPMVDGRVGNDDAVVNKPIQKDEGVTIEPYKKAVIVKGDTKPINGKLREAGGSWNGKLGGWIFPNSKRDAAQAIVDSVSNTTDASQEEQAPTDNSLRQILFNSIRDGVAPKNAIELKKLIAEKRGQKFADVSLKDQKYVQEEFEGAMAQWASQLSDKWKDKVKEPLYRMNIKYEKQPNLNVKSATSVKNQAYSTPAPLAFLLNKAVGITKDTSVLEPTAGNGLLLITNNRDKTTVNEIDPKRVEQLNWLGYSNVQTKDATGPIVAEKSQDVVVMNPPFGFSANSKTFDSIDGMSYTMKDVDHIIAVEQLKAMKDDGRAFLILGANKEAGKVEGGKTGTFLNYLYKNYNVVDHVELDGNVYSRQGADWPIRVIQIDGRNQKASDGTYGPSNGSIERITGEKATNIIESLYDRYSEKGLLDPANRKPIGSGTSNAGLQSTETATDNATSDKSSNTEQASPSTSGVQPSNATANAGSNGKPRASGASGQQDGTSKPAKTRSGSASKPTGPKQRKPVVAEPSEPYQPKRSAIDRSRIDTTNATQRLSKPAKSNTLQADYIPGSDGFNQDVLIPVNMAQRVSNAMSKFIEENGSIDGYVAEKLGYDSIEELHKSFMALQVDAAALAISKIEQGRGIIIADQTGVGKGRQAAAVIRYALQTGKTPVFITQKPNLFSDMYGDLMDIDTQGVNPFIMNTGEVIIHDGKIVGKQSPKDTKKGIETLNTGQLPENNNAVFLTYSQINKPSNKTSALKAIAENAIFVLDESHTGAGNESQVGEYLRELLKDADGVTYLSATYAKRYDNLGLYHRTSLGDAADNMNELEEAIENGGLQLQTLLSSMLSEEGELIRRERSFEGISVNTVVDSNNREKHEELFNASTDILQDIIGLSRSFVGYAKKLTKEAKKNDGVAFIGNTTIEKDMSATSFTSVVHNYISQLTMAIKAESAAERAIESIKRGQKPVIALESTMESKLNDYMAQNNVSIGDEVGAFTFGDVFDTAINNALSLSRKLPNGETERVQISISELPIGMRNKIGDIRRKIESTSLLAEIPVSPIDFIRKKISDAGYSVSEITGRNKYIDYSDNMRIVNKPVEESKSNRRKIVDRFNNGKLDVLILNQSGSTGLSIHASEKFKDQKPRHMIVAQPSLDINTFMQMLGRINRTGQLEKPSYDLLWLDLPSENRPAAVLSNKMKQLNAQTSANTDSSTSVQSIDMFNAYGDQIVKDFLEENPEFEKMMGVTVPENDVAQYITGKLAVLPVAKQREFFEIVEPMYTDHVNHLKAIGEYSLETQEIDLQAEPIEQDILHRGGGKSIFDGDVRLTKVRAKKQGKPTSPDDLQEQYDNLDKDAARGIVESMEVKMSQFVERNFDKPIAAKQEALTKARENGASQEDIDVINEDIANLNKQRTETLSQKGLVRSWLLTYAKVGSSVKIETDDSMLYGMITGVKYSPGKAGNPAAPSKFKFRVMTAGGSQNMTVSLVQLKKMGYDKVGTIGFTQLKNLFASEFNRPQFETRYIATGNIIKAFSMMQGRVITFTKKDGGKDIGMLLPTKFSPEKDVIQKTYVNSIEEALRFLDNVSDRTLASRGIMDGEGFGFYQHDGELKVAIPINNASNRGKYLDDKVLEILGEEPTWRKGAKRTSADITPAQAKALFEHIAPAFTLSDTSAEEYNRINDIEELDSVVPNNQIRFNKANAESKTGGVKAKAAKLAFKRFMGHYKGLDDNGFEQIITDKKPSEIFGPSVAADDNYIKGAFDKDTNRMFIFAQNHKGIEDVRQTIREELLVHKGLGVFSQEEIGSLITRINDTRNSKSKKVREIWEDIAQNYGGIPPLHQAEEFLGKVAQKRPSFLDNYLNKVLAQVTKMLRKAGLVKQSITMSEMRSEIYRIGELLAKGKQPENQSFDVQGAVDSGMRFNKSKPKPKAKQEVKQRLQNAMDLFGRKGMFKMLPINQMVDLYDNTFTKGHIKKYYDLLESFGAYKSKALSAIDEGAETRWDALQKESPKANTVMSRLMVNATMAQMSPDKSFSAQQIVMQTRDTINSLKREESPSASQERYIQDLEVKLIELEGMYKQLADDWRYLERNEPRAVELYKEVRKAYIDKFNETKKALLDRIMELSADEQTKGQLISMVKLQFEKQLQKGDYFPLMRNGRFAVIARKGNEYIREHFEYPGEAREAEKRYKSQGFDVTRQTMADMDGSEPLQGYAMGVRVLNQIKEMRNENVGDDIQAELADTQSFVEDMGELFKSVNNKIEADSLMDSIYQEMLKSLPNASAAKSFIHRNRTKGASNDSRRAFANSMFHSINRIAKIKYEHKFAKELAAIKDIADTTSGDGQHIVRDIHESLKERNNKTLNPDGGPVAAMLSGLGFNWLLGGSVAAGAVNLSQVPLVTFPYLSSKYGNRKAAKEMTRAYNELRGAKVNIKKGKTIGGTAWRTLSQSDSLMDLSKSEKLTEQERELLHKLADDGKIDLTQMHAMAQIADTEMRDNHGFKLPFTNKSINKKSFVDVQRAWGFFFHNAEVVNRQVTALATIRLAKENDRNLTADQLYELAANAIDETQFNYASYNRGMWAREDFGKIALMFMTYTVNIITLMAKNARRMFAGDKEARKFMVNMMGAHFLAAGAIGLPLVEAIGDAIFALKDAVDGDDEPDDFKKWMDETIRQSASLFGGDPNGDAAHMASTITRKGIFNGLAGVNIADRVGLNNLIWRSYNNPDATGSEMVSDMLMGVSPVFSIAANFLNGTQRMGQGVEQNDEELFLRGLQGFMPKAAGDVVKGFRQYNYGESTLSGTELISAEQINAWNAITQSLGFSTEKVRDLYERRSRQYKYDKVVAAKRNTLVRKTANAVMNGESMESLLADIAKYNEQFPSQAITPDSIRRHILAKQRRDQQTINGIYTPKKRMGEVGKMQYYDN